MTQINRKKNFLYTHEVKDFLLAVILHTTGAVAHPMIRVPMADLANLKGVAVAVYRPTKKLYTNQKMFAGKQMPQHEYRYLKHFYSPV